MFFSFIFLKDYKFNFTTKSFNAFDIINDQFHCFLSNETIPFKNFNDGICDCCDGSDEYENVNISCPNTCPVDVDKYDKNLLQTLFSDSILLSQQNQEKSASLMNEMRNIKVNADSEILYWSNLYQNSKYKHDYYKSQLNSLVKNVLNIEDEDDTENSFLQSLTKVFKLFSQSQSLKNNSLTSQLFNTSSFSSFANLTNQTKSLRNKAEEALKKAYEEKNYSIIAKIGDFLDKKRIYSKESVKYQAQISLAKEIKEKMETLISQNVGYNDEWRQYLTGKIQWTLPGLFESIIIENMRVVKLVKFNEIDQYQKLIKLNDVFIFSNQRGHKIFLKPICAPALVILRHYFISVTKRVFFFGTPVVCPTENTDDNFIEFFRDIQFFIDIS